MNFLNLLIVGLYYFAKRNIWNFLVILSLIGITGVGLYLSAEANGIVDGAWWSGMWQNFATEMIGAILTFALFEMLINANNRQEELTRQMASGDNATATNAVNELRALGYLFDGTLQRKSFDGANLAGVNLRNANLESVSFVSTDLSYASLIDANLSNVKFVGTNLKGTIFANADVSSVRFEAAQFDRQTILPDGTYWNEDIVISEHLTPREQDITAYVPHVRPKRPSVHPKRYLRAKRRSLRK